MSRSGVSDKYVNTSIYEAFLFVVVSVTWYPIRIDIIKDATQNITTRLTWHTEERDQAGIAWELADGEVIPLIPPVNWVPAIRQEFHNYWTNQRSQSVRS